MADLLGRRRMFIIGLIVFASASLAGGLAQSDTWLVIARAIQGIGAAIVSPAALSLVTVLFREGSERNKAMGVWGAVSGSGGAAGVLFGGNAHAVGRLGSGSSSSTCRSASPRPLLATRLLPESRNDG